MLAPESHESGDFPLFVGFTRPPFHELAAVGVIGRPVVGGAHFVYLPVREGGLDYVWPEPPHIGFRAER